jgi:hypothetical protein
LSLKTKVDGLSVVWPQNYWDGFLCLASKPVMMVFLQFGLRIGGDGFSRFDLKIGNYSLVIWASKSP